MIEETATVVSVDTEKQNICVEVMRRSTCGHCAAKNACGTAVLQKVLGNRRTQLHLPYQENVRVNDTVVLGLPENALVKGSVAVYAVPLLAMLLFAMLGVQVGEQLLMKNVDLASMLFALLGFGIGMIWLRRFSRNIRFDERYQPKIIRVLPQVV